MTDEKKLEKTVNLYQEVVKDSPNVDVASLMLNALANQKENIIPSQTKKWAYLISLGLPPFGLLFALKYYFFDDHDDAKSLAYSCLILTVISVLMFWGTTKLFSNNTDSNLKQIEQIKIQDASELLH